ncbi:MAG: YfcE family phosphodiesterase [Planctomycetota bacterium]|jgi:putative phosphoesterase
MKRYLAIGDFHIPRRAREIPSPLAAVGYAGGFDAVLCTGDLVGNQVLDTLALFAPEVLVVAGNMDVLDLPSHDRFEAEGWKIGIVHGSGISPRGDPDSLAGIAATLDVDVLVNGHTHADAVIPTLAGGRRVLLVNPGSATGVGGGSGGSLVPSLAVLELTPAKVQVICHRLEGERTQTHASTFPKSPGGSPPGATLGDRERGRSDFRRRE